MSPTGRPARSPSHITGKHWQHALSDMPLALAVPPPPDSGGLVTAVVGGVIGTASGQCQTETANGTRRRQPGIAALPVGPVACSGPRLPPRAGSAPSLNHSTGRSESESGESQAAAELLQPAAVTLRNPPAKAA